MNLTEYDAESFKIENGVLKEYFGQEKEIRIPADIREISAMAFIHAHKLRKVVFLDNAADTDAAASSDQILGHRSPLELIVLRPGAFKGSTIKEIHLPDSITRIEDETFSGCEQLSKVVLPGNLSYIGKDAFHGTVSLKNLDIPASVKLIDRSAFEESGLIKIRIPGASIISDKAFFKCRKLGSAELGSVEIIGNESFAECSVLTKVDLPEGLLAIGNEAFLNCQKLRSIVLPDSLMDIGGYAFWGNRNIEISANIKLKEHIENYMESTMDPLRFGVIPYNTHVSSIIVEKNTKVNYREVKKA